MASEKETCVDITKYCVNFGFEDSNFKEDFDGANDTTRFI